VENALPTTELDSSPTDTGAIFSHM